MEDRKIEVKYGINDVIINRTLFYSDLKNILDILAFFTFEINTSFDVKVEEELLYWKIITKIFKEPQKKTIFADFEIEVIFKIENIKKVTVKVDKRIQVNENILEILLKVALSLNRGIIIAKTYNTPLRKAYLPKINTKELVDNMKKNAEKSAE